MSEPRAFRPQIRARARVYAARNPTLSRSCQARMHNSAACNGKAVNTRIPEYQCNSSFGSEILGGESPSRELVIGNLLLYISNKAILLGSLIAREFYLSCNNLIFQ